MGKFEPALEVCALSKSIVAPYSATHSAMTNIAFSVYSLAYAIPFWEFLHNRTCIVYVGVWTSTLKALYY